MTPRQDADLSQLNTLGIPSRASRLVEIDKDEQIPTWVDWARQHRLPLRVLGGGSNLLLADRVDGLVLAMRTAGRQALDEDAEGRLLWRLAAGENWHQTVVASVEAGLSGLENLALIPGSVGAAPIQNIGAYGVELADRLHAIDAYDCQQQAWVRFDRQQCAFGYRDSLFKREENRYVITAVTLALDTVFQPVLDYGPLQGLADTPGLTARTVMDRVIALRRAKLPDPDVLPNAGSFFKNPLVDEDHYRTLKTDWPDLVAFAAEAGQWKLAAGWLIDRCGLKGQSNEAGVGCYQDQALVLVNPQRAGYDSVAAWQQRVRDLVQQRFGVQLEREPRYWGAAGDGSYLG